MMRRALGLLLLVLPLALGAPPATALAAARTPEVPSLAQVARIYPHLRGGTVPGGSSGVVPRIRKDCSWGRPYAGSASRSDDYVAPGPSREPTARRPLVIVWSMSFRYVRHASDVVARRSATFARCLRDATDPAPEVTTTRIRFGLGDERSGRTATIRSESGTSFRHELVVREGRRVTVVSVSSDSGEPRVGKALRLTRLGLRVAR